MAMELHVLSDRRLISIAEWQQAVDDLDFPLQLATDIQLDTMQGFLPCVLQERKTGFECYNDDAIDFVPQLRNGTLGPGWLFALGFRWIGDPIEMEAAWMAATGYAQATAGVIFDHQEGRAFTANEAKQIVQAIEHDLPKFQRTMEEILKRLGLGQRNTQS
jgi:hypothetical protein